MPAATLLRFEPIDRTCTTCDRNLERAIYGYPDGDGIDQAVPLIGCRSCRTCEYTSLDGRCWTLQGMGDSDGVELHCWD